MWSRSTAGCSSCASGRCASSMRCATWRPTTSQPCRSSPPFTSTGRRAGPASPARGSAPSGRVRCSRPQIERRKSTNEEYAMANPVVTFYFDIRSPYSYLARDEVLALPKDFTVSVEALPFAIALEAAHGTPETRDERAWRKVKYLYMDVRRFANERGLIIRGTVKVFDPRIAHAAFLYARRFGREQALYDRLLPAFWNREFDIEDA